jgi:hypothetical protein
MWRGFLIATVALLTGVIDSGAGAEAAEVRDQLAAARQLYNERRFDAALAAAESARTPERGDSVDLVIARVSLERFRDGGEADHLSSARDRLRRIRPDRLTETERVEFLVGLGQQLYLDGSAGAAASLFGTLFDRSRPLVGAARERVLDWWASALDREARPRADIDRQALYQKIGDRMRDELGRNHGSAAASYWLSAAAAGQGDHQAAWDAALAGWVRSPLASDHGSALRADLDVLVVRVIVPQRARTLAQPVDALRAEWDQFKQRWSHSDFD